MTFYSLLVKSTQNLIIFMFFEVLVEGKMSLLKKMDYSNQVITLETQGLPFLNIHKEKREIDYFLLSQEIDLMYFTGRVKHFKIYFGDKWKKMKNFHRNNHLSIRLDESYINLIKYYNTLE